MFMGKTNKVMVFIDSNNVLHGTWELNFKISMKGFLKILKENRNVVDIFYYEGVDLSKIHKKKVYYQILKGE